MRAPCDQHISCPGDDLALTNFSSEDPDRFLFIHTSYGWNDVTPIDDDNIIIDGCVAFSSSPISQQDADLCGDRHRLECTYGYPLPDPCAVCRPQGVGNQPPSFGDFGLSAGSAAAASASPCCNPGDPQGCCCDHQQADPDPDPGPGPGPGPDPKPKPNPHPPKLYANDRQTCTVSCPNGTSFSSSVEAGLYVAVSKALANSMAHSAACKSANEVRICPLDPYTDKCKVFCANVDNQFQIEAESRTGAELTYTITDGSLPDGMTMDDSGLIQGTPDSAGQSSIAEISICDDEGNCLVRNICFSVMGIVEDTLPDAIVCHDYNQQITVAGGTGPYSYSLLTAPSWINLSPGGLITGTPQNTDADTDFGLTVFVSDSNGNSCSKDFNIYVPTVTVVVTPSLGNGVVGQAYSGSATASGGTAPYSYGIDGALPYGLMINSGTGSVTGTPTTPGSYSFNVTATDHCGSYGYGPATIDIGTIGNTAQTSTCPYDLSKTVTIPANKYVNVGAYAGLNQQELNSLASTDAFNALSGLSCPICNADISGVQSAAVMTTTCLIVLTPVGSGTGAGLVSVNGTTNLKNALDLITGFATHGTYNWFISGTFVFSTWYP